MNVVVGLILFIRNWAVTIGIRARFRQG